MSLCSLFTINLKNINKNKIKTHGSFMLSFPCLSQFVNKLNETKIHPMKLITGRGNIDKNSNFFFFS